MSNIKVNELDLEELFDNQIKEKLIFFLFNVELDIISKYGLFI